MQSKSPNFETHAAELGREDSQETPLCVHVLLLLFSHAQAPRAASHSERPSSSLPTDLPLQGAPRGPQQTLSGLSASLACLLPSPASRPLRDMGP
ncbi:hypothetical protein Esti_003875 [Eimeria stiedai]